MSSSCNWKHVHFSQWLKGPLLTFSGNEGLEEDANGRVKEFRHEKLGRVAMAQETLNSMRVAEEKDEYIGSNTSWYIIKFYYRYKESYCFFCKMSLVFINDVQSFHLLWEVGISSDWKIICRELDYACACRRMLPLYCSSYFWLVIVTKDFYWL